MYDTLNEMQVLVDETLEKLGRADLKPYLQWNRRFTTRIADANRDRCRIRFGPKAWALLDDNGRRETIIHETCHLVTHERHGREWRAAMWRCGLRPRATNSDPALNELHKPTRRRLAYCGCGEHPMTPVKWRRTARGVARYCCRRCRQVVRLKK